MDWAHAITAALGNADTSLCFLGVGYEVVDARHVRWPGERPGPGWHGHGWLWVWRENVREARV